MKSISLFSLYAALIVATSACLDQQQPSDSGGISIPQAIQRAVLPTGELKAFVRLDGGNPVPMTINGDFVEASVKTKEGKHDFTIEFEFTSPTINTLSLATATRNFDLGGGKNSIAFEDTDYSYPDNDADTINNLIELEKGTDPSDPEKRPVIITSNPDNNGNGVYVISNINFTVLDDLDVSTINLDNVLLQFANSTDDVSIDGSIAFNAQTKTITFDPKSPLNYQRNYQLRVKNLRTTSGKLLPADKMLFKTVINPSTRSVNYSNGQISGYSDYKYNAFFLIESYVYYSGTGPDNTWFSPSDIIGSRTTLTYNENDQLVREVYEYNPDTMSNATLAVNGYNDTSYDSEGRELSYRYYYDAGSDGQWFTDNDVYDGTDITYDANGNPTRYVNVNNSGITGYSEYTYNANNQQTQYVYYSGPGADGQWFQGGDDVWSSKYTYLYNAAGRQSRFVYTTPAGIQSYADYEYNARGQRITYESYSGFGGDSKWFSPDDVLSNYTLTEYNSLGKLTRNVYGNATGVTSTVTNTYDNRGNRLRSVSYTGTDVIANVSNYTNFSYTNNDHLQATTYYNGAGPNLTWFNSDDLVGYSYTYIVTDTGLRTKDVYSNATGRQSYSVTTYDANGNRQSATSYNGIGGDMDWDSPDDVKSYSQVFDARF